MNAAEARNRFDRERHEYVQKNDAYCKPCLNFRAACKCAFREYLAAHNVTLAADDVIRCGHDGCDAELYEIHAVMCGYRAHYESRWYLGKKR